MANRLEGKVPHAVNEEEPDASTRLLAARLERFRKMTLEEAAAQDDFPSTPEDLAHRARWDAWTIAKALERTTDRVAQVRLDEALRLAIRAPGRGRPLPPPGPVAHRVGVSVWVETRLWRREVAFSTIPRVGEHVRVGTVSFVVKEVTHFEIFEPLLSDSVGVSASLSLATLFDQDWPSWLKSDGWTSLP